ncbi:MAG: MobC family plasmid mobilization relaxosome protein [Clostridiales bacterium]|nr:MobC family plasmid mobilization relaxosome protein [Clostridiales bacterium]
MKKDIQIRFRVSERENEIIKLEEKKYKNRSEFFRMLLEEKLPEGERRGVQTELEKIRMEVNRIGTNINQITKNNNSGLYFLQDKKNLMQELQEIKRLMGQLTEKVGKL